MGLSSTILENLFWNIPSRIRVAYDPLGLDVLREEISDNLVPFLTGRTHNPEEAFWCIVLLRWSQADRPKKTERNFLKWERRLKLTWAWTAKKGNPIGPGGFAGIQEAEKQAESITPNDNFKSLLSDQRNQGMLGEYRTMLEGLGLVEGVTLKNDGTELDWTTGAGEPPSLGNSWVSWRSAFLTARNRGYPFFRIQLRKALHSNMRQLASGLAFTNWSLKSQWGKAASKMEELCAVAKFASKYCDWADAVRLNFDRLAIDNSSEMTRWPGALLIPLRYYSGKNKERWQKVKKFGSIKNAERIRFLVDWHHWEMLLRTRSPSEFWVEWDSSDF